MTISEVVTEVIRHRSLKDQILVRMQVLAEHDPWMVVMLAKLDPGAYLFHHVQAEALKARPGQSTASSIPY